MAPYVEAERGRGTRLASITRHVLGLYHGEAGGKRFRRRLSEQARRTGAGWEAIEAALREVEPPAAQGGLRPALPAPQAGCSARIQCVTG
jgi:tRNA-dihydrouridine synthase A